jgi:hypothetical protein
MSKFIQENKDIFETRKELINLQKDLIALKTQLMLEHTDIPDLENKLSSLELKIREKSHGDTKAPYQSIKCAKTSCLGYYLAHNNMLECSICSSRLCARCRGNVHHGVCSEDVIASLQIIEDSFIKCPKCGVACERKDGCSQVSCLFCHTNFNSITGVIDIGLAHNPDFLEWVRSDKMKTTDMDTFNDAVCGILLPDEDHVMHLIEDSNGTQNLKEIRHLLDELEGIYRTLKNIQNKMIPALKNMTELKAKNTKLILESKLFQLCDETTKQKIHNQYYKNVTQAEYATLMLPYTEAYYFLSRDVLRKMILNPKLDQVKVYMTELMMLKSMSIITKVNDACRVVLGYGF